MAQALYRKWRPQTFDDIVGQQHIVQTLRYALRTDHIHHAYLLAGPRGTGKTTTARLIAKAVNCLAPKEERPCNECEICQAITDSRLMDLLEIDAASNTGVDNIRDLLERVGFRPTQARYKVYVIDEVHMLSVQAFNALLKTLEEPPEHVIFVLATTEVHKIPETILSRCQRFEFRRIPLDAIVGRLDAIAASEGVETEPAALELIARAATGSMRDAISLFDQMAASGSLSADYVRMMLGAERREVVRSLLEAWVAQDLSAGLDVINRAIDGGADPRQLARQTADFLRGLLLIRLGAGETWTDPTVEERPVFEALARKAELNRLVEGVRRFSEVASKQRAGWQPQLPLELAFVEASMAGQSAVMASSETTARQDATSQVRERKAQLQSGSSGGQQQQGERSDRRQSRSRSADDTREDQPVKKSQSEERPSSRSRSRGRHDDQEAATPLRSPSKAASRSAAQLAASPDESDDTAGASGPDSTLAPDLIDRIQNTWPQIIKQMPVTLGALLRDADVGGTDQNGRLVLAFQHVFHCEKIAEQTNLRKLEDTLQQLLKQPVRLRCVLAESWAPQEISVESGGAEDDVDDDVAEEDELIRRAQEELGAVPRPGD